MHIISSICVLLFTKYAYNRDNKKRKGPEALFCSVSLDQEERHCAHYKDTCDDSADDQTEVASSGGLVLPDGLDGDVAADGDGVTDVLLDIGYGPAFELFS